MSMDAEKKTIREWLKTKTKPRNSQHITARESAIITRENRRITDAIEKQRNRKDVPESEYLTSMKDPANVVEFDNLCTYFFTDIGTVKAIDGVSFAIPKGKTVGVVGESGCGKSVTALSLLQLVQRPQGQIVEGTTSPKHRCK
jgi:peptide/nickel transport system ATP-binding protein